MHDKAFNIAKNPNNDGYQRSVASMVYKFVDKKTSGCSIKSENISKKLAEELNKPIVTKFKKRKIHSPFIDNICGADLVDMQLMSKFNKEILFLLKIIDVYRVRAIFLKHCHENLSFCKFISGE